MAPSRALRFGTRGSALALAQTELVIARLRAMSPSWEIEPCVISTEGDRDKESPLTEIGGRGVFTNALEAAVLIGEVDAAVHSAKDLPTSLHPDAPIVAYPERADPRDVLVSRHGTTLDRLPKHPVIATSSRRRAVQIKRLRPDARLVDLRGNIDTRLRKAAETDLDAIVLAAAGLHRIGWQDRIAQTFSVAEVIPSPAQGALAIQARRGSDIADKLERLDDPRVSGPVTIERAFLGALGTGCSLPVGAYVAVTPDGYRLTAMLADEAGECIAQSEAFLAAGHEREHAAEIAAQLRAEVETASRKQWIGDAARSRDLEGARVVVTRPRRQAEPMAAALRRCGAEVILLPTIRIESVADTTALDAKLREAERGDFDWIVFSSANAVVAISERIAALGLDSRGVAKTQLAAVGAATAGAAQRAGLPIQLVSEPATAEALAAAMIRAASPHARVFFPRSAIGRDALPTALRQAGMDVVTVEAYQTVIEDEVDAGVMERVRNGDIEVLTFASPSSVRALLTLLGSDVGAAKRIPAVCAGSATAQAADGAGFLTVHRADDASVDALVAAVARLWRRQTVLEMTPGRRQFGVGVDLGSRRRSGD